MSSDLESYDRVNIKDGKRKPYISFEELTDKFDTDSQHLLNALKKRDVIIEDSSDMLTKEEAEFILHRFSSAYKEEAKNAGRVKRAEERRKFAQALERWRNFTVLKSFALKLRFLYANH